jgi:hypothetical protein
VPRLTPAAPPDGERRDGIVARSLRRLRGGRSRRNRTAEAPVPALRSPRSVDEQPPRGASGAAAAHVGDPPASPATPAAPPAPTPDHDVRSTPVRVHHDRLDRRVGPLELSPAEALRLADRGPASLARRRLPPDGAGGGEGLPTG